MNYNFKIRYIIIKISKRESERKQKIDKPRKARSMIALKQKKLYQMFKCNMKTEKLQTMPIHKNISKDFSLS